MGFLVEKRETVKTTEELNTAMKEGNDTTIENITVDADSVMNLSPISSSVEMITSLIASLEFKLYKKLAKNKLEEITDDKRLFYLNKEANYFTNGNTLKKNIVKDMILNGIAFVNIDKTRNDVIGLYYVESKNVVCIIETKPIPKNISVSIQGQNVNINDFIVASYNVKNGLIGNGLIKKNEKLLEIALRIQNYFNSNLKAGGGSKGIWQSEKKLGTEEFEQLKEDAKEIREKNAEIVLNSMIKYTPLNNSNKDMQIVENLELINKQLYELFGLSAELTEEQFKTFIKTKLNTIINALESAVDRALLLEDEKEQNLCFKLDLDRLTEADIKERFTAYKMSIDSGITSLNEIRLKENLEPIEGLDLFKMSIGQAFFDANTKTWIIPNMGIIGGKDNGKDNTGVDDSKDKTQQDNTTTENQDNKEKNNQQKEQN